jgi:hypothetical protein
MTHERTGYKLLRITAVVMKVWSLLLGVSALLIIVRLIAALMTGPTSPGPHGDGPLLALFALASPVFLIFWATLAILLWAGGEFLLLMVDIGNDARRISEQSAAFSVRFRELLNDIANNTRQAPAANASLPQAPVRAVESIPLPEREDDSRKVTCECGARLTVPPGAAGKRAKCPKCGVGVTL